MPQSSSSGKLHPLIPDPPPSQGVVWGEKASLFYLKGKRRVPAFVCVACSKKNCEVLDTCKNTGQKYRAKISLRRDFWRPITAYPILGQHPFCSSLPQRSIPSKKLENEEQEAVFPTCSWSDEGHHHPSCSRQNSDPISTTAIPGAHCASLKISAQKQRRMLFSLTEGCSGVQTSCHSCQAGCTPHLSPKGTLGFPSQRRHGVQCRSKHPQGSGTLCWP